MSQTIKVSQLPPATVPLVGNEEVMIVQSGTSRRCVTEDLASLVLLFANPTASVGLTAVNGVATTAMRSDAAPALSQAIVPTWTGAHTFSTTVNLNGTTTASGDVALNGTTTVSGTSIRDAALFTSGTLGVPRGGTGLASFTQGDIIYSSASNALAALAKDANATRYLSNTGASNNPAWSQVDLTNGVSGDLPFSNLAQGAALSVLGVTGNAPADVASIAAGTDGNVLRRSGTALAFGAIDLTSANAVSGILGAANGGTANGFTAFSGPTTSTKTFTLPDATATILTTDAAVTVPQGGTGLTSLAQGDVLYASASNALAALAKNTSATRYLSNTGSSNNPAWAQIDLTNGVSGALPTANGGFGFASAIARASKTSVTTRTSTATSAADPDLQVALPSAGQWDVEMLVMFGGAAAPGFRWQLTTGAFSTGSITHVGNVNGATVTTAVVGGNTDVTYATLSGGNDEFIRIFSRITVNSPGTLAFAWAQNSSNGNPTSVFSGWIVALKIT